MVETQVQVVRAGKHSRNVATAIQQAQEIVTKVQGIPGVPGELTTLIGDLQFRLGQAKEENDLLAARLRDAETSASDSAFKLSEYEARVEKQTEALNESAERANTLLTENTKLTADRNHWRTVALQWRVGACAVSVALLLYAFRGLIFSIARKAVGIPI